MVSFNLQTKTKKYLHLKLFPTFHSTELWSLRIEISSDACEKYILLSNDWSKDSHWSFTWRNFAWEQHVMICVEKDGHSLVWKASVGFVLHHLLFLPSPVRVMPSMLYFTQPALVTRIFGDRAKYLVQSHPFLLLSWQ